MNLTSTSPLPLHIIFDDGLIKPYPVIVLSENGLYLGVVLSPTQKTKLLNWNIICRVVLPIKSQYSLKLLPFYPFFTWCITGEAMESNLLDSLSLHIHFCRVITFYLLSLQKQMKFD